MKKVVVHDFLAQNEIKWQFNLSQAPWFKWTTKYLKALLENHNIRHKNTEMKITVGDIVLIKGDEENQGK